LESVKISSLNLACYHPATGPWKVPTGSQRDIAALDDNLDSLWLPSHQLELAVVLMQAAIARLESVDLNPISQAVLSTPLTFDRERRLQELIAGCLKGTLSVTVTPEAEGEEEVH
jgi:hypothetical protein